MTYIAGCRTCVVKEWAAEAADERHNGCGKLDDNEVRDFLVLSLRA